MFSLIRISLFSFLFTIISSLSYNAFAVFTNASEGADVAVCSKTDNPMMPTTAGNQSCRTTPDTYEISVFEMGVCKEHPFTNNGTKTDLLTMDKSSCSVTFTATDQSLGSVIDIAKNIGGSVDLVGASTRPADGTYGFPYVILRDKFSVGMSILAGDGQTYNGDASANVATGGTSVAYDDLLRNFGANCTSGYVGATIPIGTIDAFITNSSLQRSETTGGAHVSAGQCVKQGRLVGIINLTAPFTIDANTTKMQFNFIITDYGINMTDTDNDGFPDEYGSAPFSGTFTILSLPTQ